MNITRAGKVRNDSALKRIETEKTCHQLKPNSQHSAPLIGNPIAVSGQLEKLWRILAASPTIKGEAKAIVVITKNQLLRSIVTHGLQFEAVVRSRV